MPEEVEKRIIELFRDAIDEFPVDLRQFAEQWLASRQKAVEDLHEIAATLVFI
jgi:hypothetical protein